MMPQFLIEHFWAGWAIWTVLYISDYALTLTCARLYQQGVRDKFVFEGSFEITPYFQGDIDRLRRVSPRFLWALAMSWAILFVLWWFAAPWEPELYSFFFGAMILVELCVHKRHLRNLFTFRAARSDAIRGRLEYSRPLLLWLSAMDLLVFSALYFTLFAFTYSWFVLGGAVGCLLQAIKHWKLARAHRTTATAASSTAEPSLN
jgi:hypothetical protein